MTKLWLLPALFAAQQVMAQTPTEAQDNAALTPVPIPETLAKEFASGDGKTQASAYVVYADSETTGVDKEYQIIRFLGLVPQSQSLVTADKPYDAMTVLDPKTGQTKVVWFDISRFFGKL